jgi:hypothetical protein
MKRRWVCFTALVLFLMLGTTALAASAPPKTLCYIWDADTPVAMMSLKNQGTIKTADGPVKHYSVHGTHLFSAHPPTPLTGTATFTNGTLRFNHTCIVRISEDGDPGTDPGIHYYQLLTEGIFNTATGSGAMTGAYVSIPSAGGSVTVNNRFNITITGVACTSYSIGGVTGETGLPASETGGSEVDLIEKGLFIE